MTTTAKPTRSRPDFSGFGLPTLIGSLPAADHEEGLEWILEYTPEVPLWPQIPANPREGMMQQFLEGLPGVLEGEKTFISSQTDDFQEELLHFFEEYLAAVEDQTTLADSRFQVSRNRAAGLYLLQERLLQRTGVRAVKGQLTGPFTLLTGLTDQDQRLGYYDPAIREMVVKGLAMKGAWQVQFLRKLELPVLLFIDEPALAGLGSSSFISISLEDIGQDLTEVIEAIRQAGGLAGIHVCANTDWSFLLSLPLDVLSFDAYGFFDRLVTCRAQVHTFLERGGILAWGLIPTSDEDSLRNENTDSLVRRWEEQAGMLTDSRWDLPALLNQSLITPSCGTGSMSRELARRVLTLTRDVSAALRAKYTES